MCRTQFVNGILLYVLCMFVLQHKSVSERYNKFSTFFALNYQKMIRIIHIPGIFIKQFIISYATLSHLSIYKFIILACHHIFFTLFTNTFLPGELGLNGVTFLGPDEVPVFLIGGKGLVRM